MNKPLFVLIGTCLLLSIKQSHAQNITSANLPNGAITAHIPIYTVVSGQVTVPLSLDYYSTGVKQKDVESTAGMGWTFSGGGEVSRLVRGLPDDCEKDSIGQSRVGWMDSTNTAANALSGFTIQNDGDGDCSKGAADVNYINAHLPWNLDTEPDLFYVNAPGLSCQFVYDRVNKKFQTLVFKDYQISFTRDSISGLINSFTIINDSGIKYIFSAAENVTQKTKDGTPVYFKASYNQYQNGINYADKWSLTSITDPTGNSVQFTYSFGGVRNSTDDVTLYMPNDTSESLQYNVTMAVKPRILQYIATADNDNPIPLKRLSMAWDTLDNSTQQQRYTGQTILLQITGYGRTFSLNYSPVGFNDTVNNFTYSRLFLRNYQDSGDASPINYTFTYGGETSNGNVTILPDSANKNIDYWGYPIYNSVNASLIPKVLVNPSNTAYPRYVIYNPATIGGSYIYSTTNGYRRVEDLTHVNAGSLTSVTDANGGVTTINYEPADYIDGPSGHPVYGGGLRVSNITQYNGVDTSQNISTDYSYLQPGIMLTSGEPLSMPQFAFTVPYSGSATGQSLWDNVTILSKNDLSSYDHSIIYNYVTVSQHGAGRTQYHFSTPATNWGNNSTPICTGCTSPIWNPTKNLVGSTNCSVGYGPISNDMYNYPFIPNANFDFEQELPLDITAFNSNGNKVSETDYSYQQYSGAMHITPMLGFHSDQNPSGTLLTTAYNFYTTYYNAGELQATVKKTEHSSVSSTDSISTISSYTFGSPNHQLPTKISTTNSDGRINVMNMSYVKDYPSAVASSNVNINGLYYYRQLNINAPVESYQQVINGTNTTTVKASLTLYKAYPSGSVINYMPAQQFKMVTADGGSFTPFSINPTTPAISKDAKYYETLNIDNYTSTGFLASVDDNNQNFKTNIYDQNLGKVVASFTNALNAQVAFNDFDSRIVQPQKIFMPSGTGFAASGSHSGKAYGLNTTQTVTSSSLSKNTTTGTYIFSIWINTATPGTLTLTLTGLSTHPTITYGGTWKYYEVEIPAATISSPFTASFTVSTAASIDDILLYPSIAQVITTGYDAVGGYPICATNTNGISSYYTNDLWGRMLFTYDQDKNIVEKRTYVNANGIKNDIYADFFPPDPIVINQAVTFSADMPQSGISYTWDYGDGSPVYGPNLDVGSATHTYTTYGYHNVILTVSKPMYAVKRDTQRIYAQPPALEPNICQYGVAIWDNNAVDHVVKMDTCNTHTGDRMHSSYRVMSVGNSGYNPLTYQWQQSLDNGVTWSNTGTNANSIDVLVNGGHRQQAFLIRCLVSADQQGSGTSAPLGLTVLNPF